MSQTPPRLCVSARDLRFRMGRSGWESALRLSETVDGEVSLGSGPGAIQNRNSGPGPDFDFDFDFDFDAENDLTGLAPRMPSQRKYWTLPLDHV